MRFRTHRNSFFIGIDVGEPGLSIGFGFFSLEWWGK